MTFCCDNKNNKYLHPDAKNILLGKGNIRLDIFKEPGATIVLVTSGLTVVSAIIKDFTQISIYLSIYLSIFLPLSFTLTHSFSLYLFHCLSQSLYLSIYLSLYFFLFSLFLSIAPSKKYLYNFSNIKCVCEQCDTKILKIQQKKFGPSIL